MLCRQPGRVLELPPAQELTTVEFDTFLATF